MSLQPRQWRRRNETVEAALRGEPGAFRVLFERHYRLVHGITLARVPHCDVEDIVQEVFATVARKLPELRNSRAFSRWLTQLTRNCCIDHLRRRGRRMVQTLPPELSKESPRITEAMTVLDAMNDLPEDYREILILRFVEGYSGPEIAAHLGMTRGSARIKLHRAMKKLRGKLDAEVKQ